MKFSTTEEKRVIEPRAVDGFEYTEIKISGPCLVCEQEIQYARRGHWPSDEDHARKQFEPKRRRALRARLRGERFNETPQVATIEAMVCPECRTDCAEARETAYRKDAAARAAENERVEKRRRESERHYGWRTVSADEIDPKRHAAEFRVVFSNFELYEVLFRWRAVPGKARGDSFLMRVGMWVDGRLTAHYYEWNLQPLDGDDRVDRMFYASENDWPTSDLFGRGFCRWIERALQPRLLAIAHDQRWRPGQYAELNAEIPHFRPGTVLIEWHDGSRYVHVLPSQNLPLVAEWAQKNLDIRIEERAFRPVHFDAS
jgi:hypothetical protein